MVTEKGYKEHSHWNTVLHLVVAMVKLENLTEKGISKKNGAGGISMIGVEVDRAHSMKPLKKNTFPRKNLSGLRA